MYQGEVHIGQEQLKEFLKAAQLLQVRGLTDVPAPGPITTIDQKASPVSLTPVSHVWYYLVFYLWLFITWAPNLAMSITYLNFKQIFNWYTNFELIGMHISDFWNHWLPIWNHPYLMLLSMINVKLTINDQDSNNGDQRGIMVFPDFV